MSRTPQYNKDRSCRIISLPNGRWELQRIGRQEGTKTFDPWLKASLPLDQREAEVLLKATEVNA